MEFYHKRKDKKFLLFRTKRKFSQADEICSLLLDKLKPYFTCFECKMFSFLKSPAPLQIVATLNTSIYQIVGFNIVILIGLLKLGIYRVLSTFQLPRIASRFATYKEGDILAVKEAAITRLIFTFPYNTFSNKMDIFFRAYMP